MTSLVLRPAIERWLAETPDLAPVVLWDAVTCIAATVVAVDLGSKVRIVVTVDMHRQRHWQAKAHKSFPRRPAKAESGQRKYMIGERQQFGNSHRVVADHT